MHRWDAGIIDQSKQRVGIGNPMTFTLELDRHKHIYSVYMSVCMYSVFWLLISNILI